MIHTQEMWGAKCDSCGKQWDNGDSISYYPGRTDVEYSLNESGWHIDGDKCYCPKHHTIDENDQIVIITQ